MTTARPNLLTRDDTFFGVCQGLGEDFGFNPNWLRVALAGALFFAPMAVIASYFVLGAVVAASRWAAPRPKTSEPEQLVEAEAAPVEAPESADAMALAA